MKKIFISILFTFGILFSYPPLMRMCVKPFEPKGKMEWNENDEKESKSENKEEDSSENVEEFLALQLQAASIHHFITQNNTADRYQLRLYWTVSENLTPPPERLA